MDVDLLNCFDVVAQTVDLVAVVYFLASGVRGGAGNTKMVRLVRLLTCPPALALYRGAVAWARPKPVLGALVECCCPLRLTQQQREDRERYGAFLEDGAEEEDVEVGRIKKFTVAAFDEDEVHCSPRRPSLTSL